MPESSDEQTPGLIFEIQDFILDRQVSRVSPRTIEWHQRSLSKWQEYCLEYSIHTTQDVTARFLRGFLIHLETAGHNHGGVTNIYRSVKAFLLWYEAEYETTWKSPTRKLRISSGDDEILDPISLEHFNALIAVCPRRTPAGDRDRAILYTLLDTGLRRGEITNLSIGDVNIPSGEILVRKGKGGKRRTVIVGATTRRALIHYLRYRGAVDVDSPLWIGRTGKRLGDSAIRLIVYRRSKEAGIPEPSLHSFRRAFALNYLRNGGDVVTLQRIMGHSTLAVINRYLKLVTSDLQAAHAEYGVVDHM